MSRYRVSMDIGGTFTDVVAYDEASGRLRRRQGLDDPARPDRGRLRRARAGRRLARPTSASPSTARRRASTPSCSAAARGCCCWRPQGAGDVYHIARGNRTRLYDIHYRKPTPLVPRSDIVEIGGRLNYAGEELEPLDEDADPRRGARARATRASARSPSPSSSATSTRRTSCAREEILAEELDGVTVSLSHQVAREWREYERTSSTVIDAYIAPVVRRYLERLESRAAAARPRRAAARDAVERRHRHRRSRRATCSLQTLLSGPVGGTMGGVALARILDRPNLICIDMGGTSFDVSLVVDGKPDVASETTFEGFPLLMSVVNIHTIGAGGGSLAYARPAACASGPQSAGADPGPACYGRGGDAADRHRRQPRARPRRSRRTSPAGSMTLDRDAAERGDRARSASELGLGAGRARRGHLRRHQRQDGAGHPHADRREGHRAARLRARRLRRRGRRCTPSSWPASWASREVIVPPFPGAFSAWGMLETEIRKDFSRTYYTPLAALDHADLAARSRSWRRRASPRLDDEGITRETGRVAHARRCPLRRAGVHADDPAARAPASRCERGLRPRASPTASTRRTDTRFGHANPGAPVEVVVVRSMALGDLGRIEPARSRTAEAT